MGLLLTDEKFETYLTFLNHFTNDYFQWEHTTARKNHIDEYGIEINKGDVYYKRNHTSSHSDYLKLSETSMDKLLFLTIEGNQKFQAYGENFENKRQEDFRAAMNKVR